jgi:hypothetical protein
LEFIFGNRASRREWVFSFMMKEDSFVIKETTAAQALLTFHALTLPGLGLFEVAGGSENSMPQRKPIRAKNTDVPRTAIESGAMLVINGRGLFPGAQSPPDQDPITRYAVAIAQAWQKTVDAILEVSKVCADADDTLDLLQRMQLIARLPFGRTMFCKLVAIGRTATLHNPDVVRFSPTKLDHSRSRAKTHAR